MMDMKKPNLSPRLRASVAAVLLVAVGAAGGAGAVSLTRPGVEMAPTQPTAIARLAQTSGVVTVKGRVAEQYGDRFVVQDGSGKTLVDVGPDGAGVAAGSMVTVQGRYLDGQLHASYLVDAQGNVSAVGRPPHGPDRGPGMEPPRGGPGMAPPPGGPGGPGAPQPGGPGMAPPPPPPGVGAPPPPAGTTPPAPGTAPAAPPIAQGAAVSAPPATPPAR